MDIDEKMAKMFNAVHGDISSTCDLVPYHDCNFDIQGFNVMKDGQLCWSVTKVELLFDYVTLDWE